MHISFFRFSRQVCSVLLLLCRFLCFGRSLLVFDFGGIRQVRGIFPALIVPSAFRLLCWNERKEHRREAEGGIEGVCSALLLLCRFLCFAPVLVAFREITLGFWFRRNLSSAGNLSSIDAFIVPPAFRLLCWNQRNRALTRSWSRHWRSSSWEFLLSVFVVALSVSFHVRFVVLRMRVFGVSRILCEELICALFQGYGREITDYCSEVGRWVGSLWSCVAVAMFANWLIGRVFEVWEWGARGIVFLSWAGKNLRLLLMRNVRLFEMKRRALFRLGFGIFFHFDISTPIYLSAGKSFWRGL